MESIARNNKTNRRRRKETRQRQSSLPPMNADALALREKIRKRRVTKADVERAFAALKALQFDTGKRTNSVQILRKLRG